MGHLRTVSKPLGGVTGFFLSPVLIPHSSQPIPNQFSRLSQNTLYKNQESPQNQLRKWNKIPDNFARNGNNGVQDRLTLFITLPTPNL